MSEKKPEGAKSQDPKAKAEARNAALKKAMEAAIAKRAAEKAAAEANGQPKGKKAKATAAVAVEAPAAEKKAAKPAKAPKAVKAAKAPKEKKPKKLSCLDAAAQLLAGSKEPMTCHDLIDAMAEQSLWTSPGGKTPANTLYAAILREINVKGTDSRFKKADRGLFAATAHAKAKD